MRNRRLTKYVWKGLDTINFDVIRIIPLDSLNAIIIMRDKRPWSKNLWCVQHYGSGHYFKTRKQMEEYCNSRNWAQQFLIN